MRLLIRDAVKSVRDEVQFVYGRESDANQIKDKRKPFVNLSPLKATAKFTNDSYNLTTTYQVGLVFYRLDDQNGTEEETAKVLDQMSDFADKALHFINKSDDDEGESIQTTNITFDNVTIANIRKTPVIKVLADCLTGYMLEFDLTVPDNFDYCSIYES